MTKRENMDELISKSVLIHASACHPETKVVWGEGNLDSALVIVAEAPGAQENKIGHPFVGAAGRLLDEELLRAGIDRKTIYITNVVKCRPVLEQGGRKSNRTPNAKEINAWKNILLEELNIISPRVILCFGAVAASTLIHPRFAMNAERGQWFDGPLGTQAIATFHPAYLLRMMEYNKQPLLHFRTDLDSAVNASRGTAAIR